MKKNATTKSYAFSIGLLFLLTVHAANAQFYFAGTGAGTGNTGSLVTGVGTSSLSSANSGTANSAFGSNALLKNTTGNNNTAIGTNGLYFNTIGSFNIAVGRSALQNNISGSNNTALGYYSLYTPTTASNNTAVGAYALRFNTLGYSNVAAGSYALFNNTTGIKNTAIGDSALYYNTVASNNTAIGYQSLLSNTSGYSNTAVGFAALKSNMTGYWNNVLGDSALFGNTTGNHNISIGNNSLKGNTIGSQNISIGNYSLYKKANGDNNTALGFQALCTTTSGYSNTAIGTNALTGGEYTVDNTSVGYNSGTSYPNTYSGECTFLGASTAVYPPTGQGLPGGPPFVIQNSAAIGFGSSLDASNKVVIGNTAITSIGGQVGWTTLSDQRLKTNIKKSKLGLDFIMLLNPVTYNYKAEGQKDILYTGLIAQEVDEAAKKAGVPFSGVDKNGNYWGIRYGELTVPLIRAMQEMEEKHTAEKEILNSRIEKLEAAIAAMQQKPLAEKNNVQQQSILYQNQPNPFNQSTVIRYSLKAGDEKAVVIIRDLNGKALKQINLAAAKGSISINTGELAAGTYTYSLIINGECADTKLMVLVK